MMLATMLHCHSIVSRVAMNCEGNGLLKYVGMKENIFRGGKPLVRDHFEFRLSVLKLK